MAAATAHLAAFYMISIYHFARLSAVLDSGMYPDYRQRYKVLIEWLKEHDEELHKQLKKTGERGYSDYAPALRKECGPASGSNRYCSLRSEGAGRRIPGTILNLWHSPSTVGTHRTGRPIWSHPAVSSG